MKSRQRITISQSQRLKLSAGLQASIRALRADAAGLSQFLEEQAAENPHLRLEPAPLPQPAEWLPRWSGIAGWQGRPGGHAAEGHDGEAAPAAPPSLMAYAVGLVDRLFPSGPERALALAIAEAIEPSGWLVPGGAEMPGALPVLARLQAAAEPTGLFARDLADCLRLQAEEAGIADALTDTILSNLTILAAGDMRRLARLAGVPENAVQARLAVIRRFNPKPGAVFGPLAAETLREPDLLARPGPDGDWQVEINRFSLPVVQVVGARGDGPRLTAARGLQRMVEDRNRSLLAVAREILSRQKGALMVSRAPLLPMTMAEVGLAVGLHQSTVSRLVAGTSVDTPGGTIWLRKLFSRRARRASAEVAGGDGPSVEALRDMVAALIRTEDPAQPLSDLALSGRLSQQGVTLPRRTVAQYREDRGIPAAHRRRRRPGSQDRRP